MIRLAHFSDPHLTTGQLGWQMRDWLSKRPTGWVNGKIGRGRHFLQADAIAAQLPDRFSARNVQHVVFTGDATTLGYPNECVHAAKLLRPDRIPGIAVPGNHDYYTRFSINERGFEKAFAPWQVGDRIEGQTYPFRQTVGNIQLFGVNAAKPNRFIWDARGFVGPAQLDRLERLFAESPAGFRILVVHYPVTLANGQPEVYWRRLRDLTRLVAIAKAGDVRLWVHGHRHGYYHHLPTPELPFHTVCSGSATQQGRWGYVEYDIDGDTFTIRRFDWTPTGYVEVP